MPGLKKQRSVRRKKRQPPVKRRSQASEASRPATEGSTLATPSSPQGTPAATPVSPSVTPSTPDTSLAEGSTPHRPTASERKLRKSPYMSFGGSENQELDLDNCEGYIESLSGAGSRIIEFKGLLMLSVGDVCTVCVVVAQLRSVRISIGGRGW